MLGRKIQIVSSPQLFAWKLEKLVGREGKIILKELHKRNRGYWIALNVPYANEIEWFIPIESIQLISH